MATWTLPAGPRRRALLGTAGGLFSSLPWLPVVTTQPVAAIAWMARSFAALSLPAKLQAPLRFLSPAADLGLAADLPDVRWQLEAPAAVLMLLLLAVAAARLRPVLRFAIGFLVPAAGLAILAWLGLPAFYPGRGEALYLLPAVLLVAGAAASRPWAAVAGGLLLVAGSLTTAASLRLWATAPSRGEEILVEKLRAALPNGGTVVIGGYWRLGLWYHLGHDVTRFDLVNVPEEAAHHPGWYDEATLLSADHEVLQLRQALAGHERATAVVVTPGLSTARPLMWLGSRLGLAPAATVPAAVLWVPAGGKGAGERPKTVPPDVTDYGPVR
jgi:hypothetical protein